MERSFKDVLPLAPLQEGLLFHAIYDEESPDVYIVQITLELEGPLDTPRLKQAANTLLQRHPHLTAAFLTRPHNPPLQIIPTHTTLPFTEHNLTHHNPTTRQHHTQTILHHTRTQRFTMHKPPLLKYTLIHQTPTHHTLTLTIHHILIDGWSLP
ncbi:condensation domain-containing protein, partial [Streptomyces sp. NPDC020875]|uniref:condensation domain-containing protein n=1 Tax=Streptomyces sp. NPDC020875 TaxID=3154898 RepID=UPI0033DC5D39